MFSFLATSCLGFSTALGVLKVGGEGQKRYLDGSLGSSSIGGSEVHWHEGIEVGILRVSE